MNVNEFSRLNIDEIYRRLNTSANGLTSYEAKERLRKYGYNELEEKEENVFLKFLSYFYGPIPLMILFAALLSLILRDYADFWIILSLLILNSTIAFFQEHRAENAIKELKKNLALKAMVLRDNEWRLIDTRFIVPGDIVKVELGNIVPADGIVIESESFMVDESSLTGESLPVKKEVGDVLYDGSVVKKGKAMFVVTCTGKNTFFGKTASLLGNVKEVSDYQKQLIKIGYYLMKIAIVVVIVTLLYGYFMKHDSLMRLIRFAMILLVASIPAALPTVLSLTMVVSAKRLLKKHVIVKKLVALEELAGVNVLCCDKTGTLTKNQLNIANVLSYHNYSDREVLLYSSLASDFTTEDPIDNVIRGSLNEELKKQINSYHVLKFFPFSPERKMSDSVVKFGDKYFSVVKGAPQVIAKLVDKTDAHLILENNEHYSKHGYRVLAVAIANMPKEMTENLILKENDLLDDNVFDVKNGFYGKLNYKLVGLILFLDPPREDAKSVIEYANSMGVRVKIVSGDNYAIVSTIAKLLGIGKSILSFKKLREERSIDEKIDQKTRKMILVSDGYSEVFPKDKYMIVDIHQRHHNKVAMTGDGVNDAPALKKADVGIAVANATDAAKASANIVLLQQGIKVIVDAIEESRKLFNRMRSYAIYRIAETIRVIFFIALSIIVFNFYPLTPVMLLLLAFLNDLAILAISTDNVKISNKPEQWRLKELLAVSTVLGISGVISSFLLFYFVQVHGVNEGMIRTMIFLKLVIAGHLTLFVTRTRRYFYDIMPSKILLTASLSTIFLAILISYFGIFLTKIPLKYIVFVILYALAWVPLNDWLKRVTYKIFELKDSKLARS